MISYGYVLNLFGIICEGIALIIIYKTLPTNLENKIDKRMNKHEDESSKDDSEIWVYLLFISGLFFQVLGNNFP